MSIKLSLPTGSLVGEGVEWHLCSFVVSMEIFSYVVHVRSGCAGVHGWCSILVFKIWLFFANHWHLVQEYSGGRGSVFCVCISLMTAETLIGSLLVADFVVHIICSAFLSYIILYISFHYHIYDIFYCNNSHLCSTLLTSIQQIHFKSLYSIRGSYFDLNHVIWS